MSAKGLLVCFVGIDGSGKTTQARQTADWLGAQGVPSKYVWGFSRLWLTGSLIKAGKRLFFRHKDIYRDYGDYDRSKKRLFKHPLLCFFYQAVYLAEYLCLTFLRVGLPRAGGRTVVCDRYVFDTVVSLASDLSYSEAAMKATLRRISLLLPRPDVVFLLDLPEGTAYERKTDVPAVEFLSEKRRLYFSLLEGLDVQFLDGTAPMETTQGLVRERIRLMLELGQPGRSRRKGASAYCGEGK